MVQSDWKKNVRKIPEAVTEKISSFDSSRVAVACAKKIPLSQLDNGTYQHLGLELDEENEIVHSSPVVPPAEAGRYSRWNVEGREIVHKDQPKQPKTFSWQAPNFGDWSKGSHTVQVERMVYPRTQVPPRNLSIEIEVLGREILDERAFAIKFEVSQPLNREEEDFESDLLFALNLLQENVGHCDVFPADAPNAQYMDSLFVDWEILPPGTEDGNHDRILSGVDGKSSEQRQELVERYRMLAHLSPETYVRGQGGFQRYFGAKFSDDLVVFENTTYGNAIYVMHENWRELSQKSRLELIENHEDEFDRIEHRDGWKRTLMNIIDRNGSRDIPAP